MYGQGMGRLDGRRVLVVGASGGLGRGIATGLADEGAQLVVAARRLQLLEEFCEQNSGRTHAVVCDVTDPIACRSVIETAVDLMGGIDGLVYAPGVAAVTELTKADVSQWRNVFDTNLIGAGLVTAAAIPHLEASEGLAVYLSSVSAHLNPPWIGMGLYLASKLALEKCVQMWKLEHPQVRFSTVVIGSTSGNEFFAHADKPDEAEMERFGREWSGRGYIGHEQLAPSDLADSVVHLFASRAQTDVIWVRHRTHLQFQPPPESFSEGS
jgi:NAD(P)-dependent dehydrogenase (short-subunit alcohol dehydrogenase family)